MYRFLALLVVATLLFGCGDDSTSPDPKPTIPSNTNESWPTAASNETIKTEDTNDTAKLATKLASFGNKWKAASESERRTMADLAKVHPLFNGATKAQIAQFFGPANETGIDKFGEDVMRYELGAAPEADGGGQYHLTFGFEDGVVVRVMGNFVSISP